MRGFFIGLAAVAAAGWSSGVAAAEPLTYSIRDGRTFAVAVCAACHDVGAPEQLSPSLGQPTPGFREIANRPGVSAESLRRFVTHTHWDEKTLPITMPDPDLSPDQITNVTNYILSLRRR